ncbi:MAG: gliding motility-associated ABC transporter ATP-binding subunit GldA [Lentimicrobiaceae bacterium]|nr:gliding motility-associated ABC transporter ATP-binding subunit GldA [Lentimicrobiaceae bacterium]MBE6347130.1 gliding motility-associated ABC transporter ATP-binding subunit GldA [Lentimicrobiaceae bacterium]
MSIIVQNVTKQYDNQLALNDVSLTIGKGEIVGLLGPNGAGKSTLMKIITCFIPPTSGNVSVEGYNILEESMEVRRRVGYLPEHNPLYLDMYVKEYLEFIAGIHHIRGQEASRRIDEMIEMTGLGIEMHKKIGALSKGYRQRVGLAQAMIHNPSVLILDEPTSGLDPNQLIDIRGLIRDLGNEKTVLLSTHIMQEVEALCDKVIIINKGVVVANDNIENLTQSQSDNVLIVEFDGEVSIEMLRNIVGLKQAKSISNNHWILESKSDLDIRQDLMRWSLNNNVIIKSMQREETSIEECFQRLTKV